MNDHLAPFRMLFAVDGSEGSYAAIEWAAQHMSGVTQGAILLHAMRMSVDDALHNRYDDLKQAADTVLNRAEKILGQNATKMTAVGGAGATIAQIAAEQHAQLIVMGHSGHASIGGLGSTAFDVLHHANVPVLIVPKNAPSPSATHQLEGLNILLAVDGSQAADEATEWLNQVAPLWSAKIALFCVARDVVPTSGAAMAMPGVVQPVGPGAGVYWLATDSEPAGWEEAANLAQEETERTLKQARMLLTNCPPVSEEIGHGAPAASIVDYADSHGADLIVMGRRGHSLIGNIFNSVSYSVVQHAPVPVLVVTSTSDQEHS